MSTFAQNIGKYLENQAVIAVEDTLNELYIEIVRKTPVDTGTYLKQNKKRPIRIENDKVIGEVVNEGEYSERVEYGFRSTAVNWHMNDGTIFRNIGANTYQRAILKVKDRFIKRLKG